MKKKYDLSNLPEGFIQPFWGISIFEYGKFHISDNHIFLDRHTFIPRTDTLKLRVL